MRRRTRKLLLLENVGALLHKTKECRDVFNFIEKAAPAFVLSLFGCLTCLWQECARRQLDLVWCSVSLHNVGLAVGA